MPDQLHVIVFGLVQGVGFRHATFRKAVELGLAGWVKNLPNGEVEAVFQGERDAVDRMAQWCRRGPALARVDRIEETWGPAPQALSDFQIVFSR